MSYSQSESSSKAESELETILVQDSRIHNISDKLKYGVSSGAAASTVQSFNSVSASNSTMLSFSVRPPSESTVVDRNIYVQATVNFNITISNDAGHPDIDVFDYGTNCALQSFPLNRMFQTVTANINNCAVSINSQDVLPGIIRMMSTQQLQEYQYGTPVMPDNYTVYSDMVDALGVASTVGNSPLSGYTLANYNHYLLPRGCHPFDFDPAAVTFPPGKDTFITGAEAETWVIPCTVTLYEPILLSPLLFGGFSHGKQGFIGINNMNLVMNLDSALKRFFSAASPVVPPANTQAYALSLTSVTNANIWFTFLSTQPTSVIKSLNVMPFYDMPRYIVGTNNTPTIFPGTTVSNIQVSNIQLNQIPDRILIFARIPLSQQYAVNSDTFLQIGGISINFNNLSGLLSTFQPIHLWSLSQRNGLNMNWYEWSGVANAHRKDDNSGQLEVGTVGSLLCINPAYDLSLPPFLANGSLGQFTLQFQITLTNNYAVPVTPEIVTICLNSGMFQTNSGSSSYYSGLLNKETVLDAQKEGHQSISDNSIMRLVGGGRGDLHDMATCGLKHLPIIYPKLKEALREEIQSFRGMGASGGGGSGGRKSKMSKFC